MTISKASLKTIVLLHLFAFFSYFWISYKLSQGEVPGNDLFHYSNVIGSFQNSGFSLLTSIGLAGSSEPLFWYIVYLFTFSHLEPATTLVCTVQAYLVLSYFICERSLRRKFLLFVCMMTFTSVFANALGNNLRSFCSILLITAIMINVRCGRPSSKDLIIYLLLLLSTHYASALFLLVYLNYKNAPNVKTLILLLTILIAIAVLQGEFISNIFYKLSVYIRPNEFGSHNSLLLYSLLIQITLIVKFLVNRQAPVKFYAEILVILTACYFYYVGNFLGISRLAVYFLVVQYLRLFWPLLYKIPFLLVSPMQLFYITVRTQTT